MRQFFIVLIIWLLWGSVSWAQQPYCPTRPPGDSTNACASTAFVTQAISLFDLLVGTTGITGATNGQVLYNNNGVLGAQTPNLTAGAGISITGAWPNQTIANTATLSCTPIQQYGGAGDGVTDNTSAYNAFFTALSGANGCLAFPPGTYVFSAKNTKSLGSTQTVSFVGSGITTTTISFPTSTTGGFEFDYSSDLHNSVNFYGMTISSSQAGGGTGILLSNVNAETAFANAPPNIFRDLLFTGNDGPFGLHYWTNGVSEVSVSQIHFDNVTNSAINLGNGVSLQSNTITGTTNNSTANGNNTLHFASTPAGIKVGMFVYDTTTPAVGVYFVQSTTSNTVVLTTNIANGPVGNGDSIVFQNPAVSYYFSECNFVNDLSGIVYGSGVQGVVVNGSNFEGVGGIFVNTGEVGLDGLWVTASQFATTKWGITIASGLTDTAIIGSTFGTFDTAGLYPTILIQANTIPPTITGNTFFSESGGTNIGVDIGGGGSSAGIITGNIFRFLSTAIFLANTSSNINVQSNAYGPFVGTKVTNNGGAACPADATHNCVGGGSS